MARILLVDDEDLVRNMLRVMLEGAGYEVEEACDGVDALHKYRVHPSDLVLIDLIMPKKDGLTLASELWREFPQAKIVGMTGGVGILDFVDHMRRLGVRHVLRRPFDLNVLLQVVREELDREVDSSSGAPLAQSQDT
jgi:two-component system response regulator (stage 0 sporulation protein F)